MPGAGGEDTNQSEKDKQEKCENQLPLCACAEGEGSDCSSKEGRQLCFAPAAQALWVPAKSGHRNTLLIINLSKADCCGMH